MDAKRMTVSGKGKEYTFIILNDAFTLEELAQAFPGATSLAYEDALEKVIIPNKDGIFRTPEDGWDKRERKYFVVEGKEGEPTRDERIKDIMKKIREQKSHPQPQKRKSELTTSNEKYTRTRRPKIRVGWRHFKNDSFKQVFFKDGGGVREVLLPSLELEVNDVIQIAKEVMFPRGECKYGSISQMQVWLGDYAGEKLRNFEIQGDDKKGEDKQCLGKYLKAQGLHLSRCTFYLMTREKNSSSANNTLTLFSAESSSSKHFGIIDNQKRSKEDEPSEHQFVPINFAGIVCEKQIINIQYVQENFSKYDSEKSLIKCHSISQCQNITSFTEYVDDDDDYNPCLYGFFISRIRIGQKCFLDCMFERHNGILEKDIKFPSSNKTANFEGIIIHEPMEIWGYDGDKFVLGIVAVPAENAKYEWFKDNIPVNRGESCIYIVKEPGMYACQVSYADVKQMSKPIQIIEVSECASKTYEDKDVVSAEVVQTRNVSLTKSTDTCVSGNITGTNKAEKDSSLNRRQEALGKEKSSCFAAPEVKVDDLNIDYSTTLGSGAFGTVYKGKWAGSVVAVKALTVTKRNPNTMLEMVEKEIHISSKICHPNIVLFLAVARAPATIYLVHEYIDGCNMEDAIFDQETKQLMDIKPEHKLFILRQCVQGVAYLHALVPPVIHQDIKPSNIMIKKICHTTKLCDLGVSRIKSVRAASMCTTQMGTAFGTPSYMAPECLLHNEKTCISSDIWSLGVTLIEFAMEQDAWEVDAELDAVDAVKRKMERKNPPIPNVDAIQVCQT
ncbi:uncharacterized protein LOC133174019 [Saccostrea echinata]|uniref:uncharacterized protein LOC133174019 n=1 Tax=Saccostrea echinata TaxID=191078 RepID=UPI002A82DAF9|nr:uncharacterized protein LOC133174019 [Saccostrea echinata]